MTPEGKVKRDIKTVLRDLGLRQAGSPARAHPGIGWYYMPVPNGMGASGIPDFMGCFHGRLFGIEAKANGKLSGPQEQRRDEMLAADAIWILVDATNVSGLADNMVEQLLTQRCNQEGKEICQTKT